MTTEAYRAGYRERLSEGQVVYTPFPRWSSLNLTEIDVTRLSLNKGVIFKVGDKRYSHVTYWDDPNVDPKRQGLVISMSPRYVFTEAELRDILDIDPEINVDSLMNNPATSRKAALQLLTVVVERMGDDLERNPQNPEY